MNERANLIKTLNREGWEKIPCDITFTPPKEKEFYQKVGTNQSIPDYFGLSHRTTGGSHTKTYEGDGTHLFAGQDIPEKFDVDQWGVGMSYGSEAAFHMCHFHSPLTGDDISVDDIQRYPFPVHTKGLEQSLKKAVTKHHNKGLAVLGSMEQTIWEQAWLIRGMDNLMIDMLTESDRATVLLDKITEYSCKTASMMAHTKHDIIALGDDVGMQSTLMMSPEIWRKWLKPRLAKVINSIRNINPDTLIFYHSCGFIEPLIPELIEIGVNILNPVQPESMDFAKIHQEYGKDLSFWGGVGTQTTFPFGTPEDVRQRVQELAELGKDRGGIVIAPTHVLEPEVPWENIEAMRDELLHINGKS